MKLVTVLLEREHALPRLLRNLHDILDTVTHSRNLLAGDHCVIPDLPVPETLLLVDILSAHWMCNELIPCILGDFEL